MLDFMIFSFAIQIFRYDMTAKGLNGFILSYPSSGLLYV